VKEMMLLNNECVLRYMVLNLSLNFSLSVFVSPKEGFICLLFQKET